MTNEDTYEKKSEHQGIRTYSIYKWAGFSRLFDTDFVTISEKGKSAELCLQDYIWRGHRCQDWRLVSFFDRQFETDTGSFVYKPDRTTIMKRHLNSFVYSARNKFKEFALSIREIKAAIRNGELSENHLWALAQHYGLKTPLLDWCYSPYVAAYFACQAQNDTSKGNSNRCRVVWGLNYKQVCIHHKAHTGIDYFDPMSSEHHRLVNQRGLFTITRREKAITEATADDIDIEGIITNYECAACGTPWLIKLEISDSKEDRQEFLHRLNSMNINHTSLFPEIEGAAEFANIGLELEEYARFHGQTW